MRRGRKGGRDGHVEYFDTWTMVFDVTRKQIKTPASMVHSLISSHPEEAISRTSQSLRFNSPHRERKDVGLDKYTDPEVRFTRLHSLVLRGTKGSSIDGTMDDEPAQ